MKLIDRLQSIPGIGNDRAKELVDAGLRRYSDLKRPKFYKSLPEEAKVWINYPVEKKISYNMAKKIMDIITQPDYLYAVGSYRRKKPYMKDLDILSTKSLHKTLTKIKKILNEYPNISIAEVYARGPRRYSLLINYSSGTPSSAKYIRADMFYTEPENLPAALLHFTGGKDFNIRIRAHAKKQGYKLNQYGLFSNGKKIPVKSEKEILDIIGVTWKDPKDRE